MKTNDDGSREVTSYIEHIYSYDTGTSKEIYTNKECNQGICGWQDTLNEQGKRTIKKFNYNTSTGEYSYYDENIYADNGTTITGKKSGCNSSGVCTKCTGSAIGTAGCT